MTEQEVSLLLPGDIVVLKVCLSSVHAWLAPGIRYEVIAWSRPSTGSTSTIEAKPTDPALAAALIKHCGSSEIIFFPSELEMAPTNQQYVWASTFSKSERTDPFSSPGTLTTYPHSAKYPHKCSKCGSPAYIGFNKIDCSNGLCQ